MNRRVDDEAAAAARGVDGPPADAAGEAVSPLSRGPGDELFHVFAETVSDAILVIDSGSHIHFANRAAEKIFGYGPEELQDRSLTLLMPEYLRHLHREGLTRYLETGERHVSWGGVELPGLHRDGREIELEIAFSEFSRGGRHFFTGIARDISERKRAERRLAVRHAAARAVAEAESTQELAGGILRAVCENLHWKMGAYWGVDRDAGVLRCVESWGGDAETPSEFNACTGGRTFRRGEGLPGRVWERGASAWVPDVLEDDNFPRAQVAAREGLRAGFGFPVRSGAEVVGVMEFFSHEVRPPDAELDALMSSLGSQLGQFAERKRFERGLRAAEESQRFLAEASELLASSLDYETTLQSTAQLVVPYLADWCIIDLLGPDGRIERVAVAHQEAERAAAVREMTRRSPVDPRANEGVARVVREGRAQVFPDITDEILAAVYPAPEKLQLVRRLGLRSAMIVPLSTGNRTLGAISFATAESARRYTPADLALAGGLAHRAALAIENARLYREAREVNRLKDEFLATLSHELRTPLTAVLGWTALLRGAKLDAATAAGALETIERNARAQKQLIDDLLDASRIISGKLRIDFRPTPLAGLIEAAVESARPAAGAKGVALRAELGADDGLVSGDPDRLQQVVWNLLSNAIKFTPEGGRVEVRLAVSGGQAEITVSDTGKGIEPNFLPHVFDRFRQADASTTRAHGGLGLGLSIVSHLVELHGGTVAAESGGAGRGAAFRVRLPTARPQRAEQEAGDQMSVPDQPAARQPPPAVLSGVRVLVVEDDPDTLYMLGKTLERYGASATGCETADAALEAFRGGEFDLLISDIGMPGRDGYTLVRRLRALEAERGAKRLPAIALTAYARNEDRAAALEAGFEAHLAKPVAPAELAEAAAKLTGRAAPD
ncbi:MAG: GAF domain-containing protein [Acidobacteria bacterium]|nr:GAF domain-containing protein [Acidobacteriota bacterium]